MIALVVLVGCDASTPSVIQADLAPGTRHASHVAAAPARSADAPDDPYRAVNGVRGAGASAGSLDVYSLGLEVHLDAWLVLDFDGDAAWDVPGPDLVVFENPFDHPAGRFFDPMTVEVSHDGVNWVAFDHDLVGGDETQWEADPTRWQGFAGLTPVLLHEEHNPVDPFSVAAGGDAFDFADLPDVPLRQTLLDFGVRYVRLTTAAALINPDTQAPYPADPISNGADVDGVYAAWVEFE